MFSITRTLEIEWGQCDPAGIVFSPRYWEMFDAATAALFVAALGEPKAAFVARYDILGIPLASTSSSYHAPCRYGDVVTIHSAVERVGRSSVTIVHRLMRGDVLAVEARETRVWAARRSDDPNDIGAVPLPADVAVRLAANPN